MKLLYLSNKMIYNNLKINNKNKLIISKEILVIHNKLVFLIKLLKIYLILTVLKTKHQVILNNQMIN